MLKLTNIDFDYDLFLKEYYSIKHNERDYARGGKSVDYWKVIRLKDLKSELVKSYVEDFKNKYNIPGKVDGRFYRLKANTTLPMHIDSGTKCSINFLLNGDGAPVIFESGEYTYKQALLNTSIMHSVINGDKDRILFKISIFELDFDQVSCLLSK
jgi:hypothetical protein|tara:strand:- start:24 stop:488 length:465 start_codon:yes stop_codon:yes gene_type:complete